MRFACAVFGAMLLGACSGPAQLPPPGAEGPIVIHLWKGGDEPMEVVGGEITPLRADMRQARLAPVLLRAPHRGGVLCLAAPAATYALEGGRDRLGIVAGPEHGPRPVELSGLMRGAAIVGRARDARLEGRNRTVELVDLLLVRDGVLTRAERASMDGERIEADPVAGQPLTAPAPPAVTAALAALPSPLALPRYRRGMRLP